MTRRANIKLRRIKLFEQCNRCHWCGVELINPIGPRDGVITEPNHATLDHLRTRFDPDRTEPNHYGEERTVLACYKCNQERGREKERQYLGRI